MSAGDIDELGAAIGRFRILRCRFEQVIPATAVSADGRSFGYRIAIGSAVSEEGGSDVPAAWARAGAVPLG